jgi:hypothetical protein
VQDSAQPCHVHTDQRFSVADHEAWGNLNAAIVARLEQKYNQERLVDVRPTQVILGLNVHHQITNVNSGACCDEIRDIAGRSLIPVTRMQVQPKAGPGLCVWQSGWQVSRPLAAIIRLSGRATRRACPRAEGRRVGLLSVVNDARPEPPVQLRLCGTAVSAHTGYDPSRRLR